MSDENTTTTTTTTDDAPDLTKLLEVLSRLATVSAVRRGAQLVLPAVLGTENSMDRMSMLAGALAAANICMSNTLTSNPHVTMEERQKMGVHLVTAREAITSGLQKCEGMIPLAVLMALVSLAQEELVNGVEAAYGVETAEAAGNEIVAITERALGTNG